MGRERSATFERTPRGILVGIALALVGGVLWGCNATVAKLLMSDYGASPLWIACMREVFAGLMFLALAAALHPKSLLAAARNVRGWPHMLCSALICVLAGQVCYLQAIDWTNGGTATVLQTLNLLFVLVWVCVRGRRLPGKRESVGVLLAFIGTVLIATGGDLTTLKLPLPGLAWGIGNALATGALTILPVALMAKYGNLPVNGIMFFVSGLILCPFVRPWATAPALDAHGWALVAFTIIGGTFGAYMLFLAGTMRVGSMRATMLGTVEPMTGTVTAVLFTAAVFTPADLVGFILILVMVFLVR